MIYNLNNPLQTENFKLRCNKLFMEKATVELRKIEPIRTDKQNKYLHLILRYFACEYGETEAYVKQKYFKEICNAELFRVERMDKITKRVEVFWKSTADLAKDEMTLAIERFRNWSSMEANIYIPSAEESELLMEAQSIIARNKNFI